LSSVSLLLSSEYLPSSKESKVDKLEVRTAGEGGGSVIHTLRPQEREGERSKVSGFQMQELVCCSSDVGQCM